MRSPVPSTQTSKGLNSMELAVIHLLETIPSRSTAEGNERRSLINRIRGEASVRDASTSCDPNFYVEVPSPTKT